MFRFLERGTRTETKEEPEGSFSCKCEGQCEASSGQLRDHIDSVTRYHVEENGRTPGTKKKGGVNCKLSVEQSCVVRC